MCQFMTTQGTDVPRCVILSNETALVNEDRMNIHNRCCFYVHTGIEMSE